LVKRLHIRITKAELSFQIIEILLEKIAHYHKEKENANAMTLRSGKPLVEVSTKKIKEGEPNKGNLNNLITIQEEKESIETKEPPKKPSPIEPYIQKILFP